MSKQPAIELRNITKTFGKVVANKNVNLTAYRGEILSILGENGSGKTTLMNMISGIYFPDEGQIFIDEKEAHIASPKDAFTYKIGMIHQHFKLVDVFSAAENIVLGIEDGKYNLKEGIVIDTRYNGGGRLHEDIEILFSGEKYLEQVMRGKISCEMPSRRYNKHSIMLVCEANYSNAHGTPWVYSHMGLGKTVGMPVPGTMTSVNWEYCQDSSIYYGIPVVGYRTKEGTYLENSQLEPDFLVKNKAEEAISGRDEQLEVAVKELLKQIDADKANRW